MVKRCRSSEELWSRFSRGRMREASNFGRKVWEPRLVGFMGWKGGPVYKSKHGGWRTACTIYVAEFFEMAAFSSVAGNLVTYMVEGMHYPTAEAFARASQLLGASFALALVGGFLSDCCLPRFWAIVVFSILELGGGLLLTIQAHMRKLHPPTCSNEEDCAKAHGIQILFFDIAIFGIALGSGSLRAMMVSHGGDQFDEADGRERKDMSSFFIWFFFFMSGGAILGLTGCTWVQDNVGFEWGYGLSSAIMFLSMVFLWIGAPKYRVRKPQGNPFTRVAQVFVAAYRKRNLDLPCVPILLHELSKDEMSKQGDQQLRHTKQFKCLDKAALEDKSSVASVLNDMSPWYLCSLTQVEEAKMVIRMLPILACNIVPGCVLAQLHTLVLREAAATDRRISQTVSIPAVSMMAMPFLAALPLVPVFDYIFLPAIHKLCHFPMLLRIGLGLIFSSAAPALCALFEMQRSHHLWPAPPLGFSSMLPLYLGYAIFFLLMFTGSMELFYIQSPPFVCCLSIALLLASLALGYVVNYLIIAFLNLATRGTWIMSSYNLQSKNQHIEIFYWVLFSISVLNVSAFFYIARGYQYQRSDSLSSSCDSTNAPTTPSSMEVPATRLPMLYYSNSSPEIAALDKAAGSNTSPSHA